MPRKQGGQLDKGHTMKNDRLISRYLKIGAPEEAEKRTVIVLHGIGTDEDNLVPLIEYLQVPGHYHFIRGPFRYGPNGFAYFEVNFTPQGPVHNKEQAIESLSLLKSWVVDMKQSGGIPAGSELVFMGFSQGAIMSYAMAFSRPDLVDKVVGLNGRVLKEIEAKRPSDPAKKIKINALYGLYDDVQPMHFAHEARERFKLDWVELNFKEGACAHEVTEESADFAKRALLN